MLMRVRGPLTDRRKSGRADEAASRPALHARSQPTMEGKFAVKAMELWAYQSGVKLDLIRPGKPVENGYIESFNGRLRDECLNGEIFFDLVDAREKLERWREDYNEQRSYSSLTDRTPAEFAQGMRAVLPESPRLLARSSELL
jgi:hypothetical protein